MPNIDTIRSNEKVLITGATGYVGFRLAKALLRTGARLVLPVRAKDDEHLAQRRDELLAKLGQGSIEVIACDIAKPEDVKRLPVDCTIIIHSAATTKFNVEADVADRENRDASISLFHLGRRSKQLKTFAYISTVYAAGMTEGLVPEEILARPEGFVNHYERSKWETEHALNTDFSDLPWTIMRVATVLADNKTGEYSQMNAVHNTLKLLYYGLISTVPGDAAVPIYLVCGDFVEKGILAALDSNDRHQVYHVCHEASESLTVESLMDIGYKAFLSDESFKKRGIQKPLLVDLESFAILADGISGFGGAVLKDAVGSMVPFARQLFIKKNFENTRLRSVMPDYEAARFNEVLPQLINKMIEQKWKLN
ncbi:MAG: SDR family NAD(P)-dependent oxidoreductase [Chitinophagaceae bacterium]|nr:SDR family NAD(P)-dependent oxidoreductase [Oligoflexus sp.]